MALTMISFLGRTPKDQQGYRKTRYDFSDNSSEEVAFFGWALHKKLQPKKFVILGTAGSMWDHLFEGDFNFQDQQAEARMQLMEAVERKNVSQAQLDALKPVLSAHLNCEVDLQIIPYCQSEAEQVQLLQIIAHAVAAKSSVHLDVTHGFRHLPMLTLLAALYLRIAYQSEIKAIWYAAYDPDTRQAPVHNLAGLLRIADGLQALASFNKDGDYSVFLPLFKQATLNSEAVTALQKAAYYENILNVGEATGALRQFIRQQAGSDLPPDLALLWPIMQERMAWVAEEKQFEKQSKLARLAWERGDYLRCTLYAYEAVITRICLLSQVNINNFAVREQARESYQARLENDLIRQRENYNLLKNLRNQIAHGTRGSSGDIQQILATESKLRETLNMLLQEIESKQLPSF
jgi:CRISPR-associated Csx2 family protein